MEELLSLSTITSGAHNVFFFLIIISIIVFIHEGGHFLVARWCGVKIETFSIGFGKELFGWSDKHGTRWKFCLIPLGGYVKMFGDDDAASSPDTDKIKQMSEDEKSYAFFHKPLASRFAIVLAGPAANFILAILILGFFFSYYGRPVTTAEIGGIMENSAAEEAGLEIGDVITELDGTTIDRFAELQGITAIHPDMELTMKYQRNGVEYSGMITPKSAEVKDVFGNTNTMGRMGVSSGEIIYEELNYFSGIKAGVTETYSICARTMTALGQMITGNRDPSQLSGLFRIAEYSGQAAERGIRITLWFMAVLSINLGLINLFPIPMLDGGHLFFYIIEAVRRKPLSEKAQDYSLRVGFVLLMSLMAFAIFNDFAHFAKKFGIV